MKSINQLVYSIASIFAIVSACAALPINVASIDHTIELFVGLLALTCISITILACTCCHRNKSGFEEFENENTIVDQTNSGSRSEFPIFRAISPPNACHSLNNAENNLDNRILSNIVNQNQMNRTFNEFENSQNNNGPISVVDMENIQNNNAMDYIPNRNEINIIIEPSPHSINRNLVEVNRISSNNAIATTSSSLSLSLSAMHVEPIASQQQMHEDHLASGSSFEPYYQMNEFNAYRSDEMIPHFTGSTTASESLNNYIDLEDDDIEFPIQRDDNFTMYKEMEHSHDNDDAIVIDDVVAEFVDHRKMATSMEAPKPISHLLNGSEIETADDDAIGVEEALRALDFAISGGESFLSDYQDSDDSDIDTTEDKPHDTLIIETDAHENPLGTIDGFNDNNVYDSDKNDDDDDDDGHDERTESALTLSKCTELNENDDAKDKISVLNEAELIAESTSDIPKNEHSREYVYEVAHELVDSVLKECTERISLVQTTHVTSANDHDNNDDDDVNDPKHESHTPVTAISLFDKPIASSNHSNTTERTLSMATAVTEAAPNKTVDLSDLDDSMDETFVVGKLETTSTPCHRTDFNIQRDQMRFGVNLFHTLDEVNESALSTSGIEPLQKTQTDVHVPIAYATFEVQSNEPDLTATFTKNDDVDDKKCIAPVSNQSMNDLHGTFVMTTNEIKPQNQVPRSNPTIKIDKEEANSDDLTTQTPMNTPIELNYVGESWDQFVSKSMNNKSSDLQVNDSDKIPPPTTITPAMANTISTTSKNSWFLHEQPESNETFDINDSECTNYDGLYDDSESIEENPELLSLTFDALRKQLAESLPQASVRPSIEYSDDEDNASDSDMDCDNLEYNARFESAKSEVVINYKQQLSPILEESEDETCKTFVLNETKCLDSTSTGCIETSEAIMGVTKVLMASNDTLFNFEDTLGDRDDMLSPRSATNSGTNTAKSITPQPEHCKTPTNEAFLAAYPADYKPSDVNAYNENNHVVNDARPSSLQLNFENLTNNLSDLLSPEQQKTFSEEINTVEQLSSELSATIDATNTLDDLRTCISVHMNNDDLNNVRLDKSKDEVTATEQEEEDAECEEQQQQYEVKSPIVNGSLDISEYGANSSIQITTNEIESPISDITTNPNIDIDISSNKTVNHSESDTSLHLLGPIESAKENKSPNLDSVKHVTKSETKSNLNKTTELNEISEKEESQPHSKQNHFDALYESAGKLSGEEDPWATHPITDIRFTGPRTDDVMQQLTGTFTTNDWDSDIEDSNSSEEFLYAKGVSQIGEYLRSTQDMNFTLEPQKQIDDEFDDEHIDKSPTQNESSQETGDEQLDTQDIWNSHEDLIAVTTNADADSADDVLDESSISENENEWIPSSWDSCAKPVRSALKSPDKSSSKTGTKSRRSVVFKKQNYQSVYEYPKESSSLSPTQNDRQGWANYLVQSSPFSSGASDSYLVDQCDESNSANPIDFDALNGFSISSSSRPFHLNQFGNDCHTWPTESEFSWSQIQSDKELANSDNSQSTDGWTMNSERNGELSEPKSPNSIHRPDSGVGESAELFSESLGDLCHTKSSLRLPLTVYSIGITNENEAIQSTSPPTTTTTTTTTTATLANDDQNELSKSISQNDSSENVVASDSMYSIVPTSCTGSMESINSFDGGKSSQNHLSNSTNAVGLLINNTTGTKCVSIETSVNNDITTNPSRKCNYRTTANRQSDSTDEDSGIENIVRVTKEI